MFNLIVTDLDTLECCRIQEQEPDTVLDLLRDVFLAHQFIVLSEPLRRSMTVYAPKYQGGSWRIEVQENNS